MHQITFFVENKPGELSKICELLEARGIEIQTMAGGSIGDGGIIRILTEADIRKIENVLKGTEFNYFVEHAVIPVRYEDKPGELRKILRKLADNDINIESFYRLGHGHGFIDIGFKVDNVNKTKKILKDYITYDMD